MLKFLKIFVLFILILLFVNCKKDRTEVHIIGKIKAYNEITDVSSVSVTLYGKKVESGSYNASYNQLASTVSDNSGSFSIIIEKENISEYKIKLLKNSYFSVEELFYGDNFSDGTYSSEYDFVPSADISIKILNASPKDDNDFFKYRITSGYIDAPESCLQSSEYYGMAVDEEIECKLIAGQNAVFEWVKTKDGQSYNGSQTIFCNIDGNNSVEFNY